MRNLCESFEKEKVFLDGKTIIRYDMKVFARKERVNFWVILLYRVIIEKKEEQ